MALNALPPAPPALLAALNVPPSKLVGSASLGTRPASMGPARPAWVDAGPVSLEALLKEGEASIAPPGSPPKLVAISPWRDTGPVTLLVHGIGGDPGNQEILARAAQARGERVVVVAYDTWTRGASENALVLAAKLRGIQAAGPSARPLSIIAHSLGALTTKGAFDRLWGANNRYQGPSCRFVALGAPWGGATPATLARFVLPRWQKLAWARDLDPGSSYWQRLRHTPFPREVAFYDLQGGWDTFSAFAWGPERQRDSVWARSQALRADALPATTHNAPNWDLRVVAWALDPERAPAPSRLSGPGPLTTLVREAGASMGLRPVFSEGVGPGGW